MGGRWWRPGSAGWARWCRIPAPGGWWTPSTPAAIASAILSVLDDPPAPEACRRAAEPHALTRQAGRVAEVLEGAVAAHREASAR